MSVLVNLASRQDQTRPGSDNLSNLRLAFMSATAPNFA